MIWAGECVESGAPAAGGLEIVCLGVFVNRKRGSSVNVSKCIKALPGCSWHEHNSERVCIEWHKSNACAHLAFL